MMRNYQRNPHINVEMSPHTHQKLKSFMAARGIKTNLSFIELAIEGDPGVMVNVLEVDGKPAASGSVLLQVGECLYHWANGVFQSFPEAEAVKLLSTRGSL